MLRVWLHVCKLLKARGMVGAVCDGEQNSKMGMAGEMARGFGSDHACET
jgi:hypothetical protein